FDLYEVFRERNLDSDSTRLADFDYSADAVTRPSPPYEDPTFGMGKYGYPAVSMTQYAALKFCKWLWQKTGRFYRLPTEAEWEYACRAGSTTAYSFGDDMYELDDYAWYYENSDEAYHEVGTKLPNAWGIYDMHGNVSEWCLDQYDGGYYATLEGEVKTPWRRPTSLHPRSVRGGSWDDDPEALRSANRIESSLNWKRRDPQIPKSFWWNTDSPFVGLRLVSPIPQPTEEEIRQFWRMTLDE
ncbi:MAG: formylglycine-generating enzyme family protein, partial [Bacteroidetes bacterium]